MITFVGAGTGAEDLITVRGMRLLESADVIIYAGSLVNPGLLKYAGKNCVVYDSAHMTLEEVLGVMEEAWAQGKEVVRLHTGDPSIYGAVREQMDCLEIKGIPYACCPGVTACFGAAASLHLEYTLPGVAQSLIITRMEGRTGVPEGERIESLAAHGTSMAIYLSAGRVEELCRRLVAGGYKPTTMAALVYKATWPDEESYVCPLEELPRVAREHHITKTALVLVGEAIAHAHFERSRLYDGAFETNFRRKKSFPQTIGELGIVSFTQEGAGLAKRLGASLENLVMVECKDGRRTTSQTEGQEQESVQNFVKRMFDRKSALLFIGACGIAVRLIAPFVKNKLTDSPVVVMDEKGRVTIPLLSGHVGGANELAEYLATCVGAEPIITTATDGRGLFAVDVWAAHNGLCIQNKEGIAGVSAKLLAGEKIQLSVEGVGEREACEEECGREGVTLMPFPPVRTPDILVARRDTKERMHGGEPLLWLKPREYVLGMGCRKGKSMEELLDFVRAQCEQAGIGVEDICALASLDVKKEEKGLIQLASFLAIPFLTYSAEQLMRVEGVFHTSDFVEEAVGADNVCERAAVAACHQEGRLILEKRAKNGMTAAIAYRPWHFTGLGDAE